MYLFSAYLLFSDGKDELKTTANNIYPKAFQQFEIQIKKLQKEGQNYASQGKYDNVEKTYQKASNIFLKAVFSNFFQGRFWLDTGINYMKIDKYENAKKYLLLALKKFKDIKDNPLYWRGTACLYLARNARYHKKWQEAEKYYEQTAELLEKYLAVLGKSKSTPESKPFRDIAFEALCISYKWLQRYFCVNQTQAKALAIYEKAKRLKADYPSSALVADIYPGLISNFMDLKKIRRFSKTGG